MVHVAGIGNGRYRCEEIFALEIFTLSNWPILYILQIMMFILLKFHLSTAKTSRNGVEYEHIYKYKFAQNTNLTISWNNLFDISKHSKFANFLYNFGCSKFSFWTRIWWLRDRSQTLVRGRPDAKNCYRKHFSGLPPPFRSPKISGQPQRKAFKTNFNWKICGIFFKAPLTRIKNFKGPLFATGPPNKCLPKVSYSRTFVPIP